VSAAAARAHAAKQTKPPGSLGRVEDLAVRLAGMRADAAPSVERPMLAVFAADHGVTAHGVSAWPAEVTAQMVRNFAAGGAAVNVLARTLGFELLVVDAGVDADLEDVAEIRHLKVRRGTADFVTGAAMSAAERDAALRAGVDLALGLVAEGVDLLACGDMGIGNTSAAALLMSVLLDRPIDECVGAGAGLDPAAVARKRDVLARARRRVLADCPGLDLTAPGGALAVLEQCGGLEVAMMAGAMLGAASARVPVLVDGFIASSALLAAWRLDPRVLEYCVFAHRSGERAHGAMLEALGARPLLDLGMRLGEGSGAALAIPIVRAALALLAQMATFESAGVSGRCDA
jgi:nicotinate-nucleotide--dimethylbenzimidazole phosphoribosyltransferase